MKKISIKDLSLALLVLGIFAFLIGGINFSIEKSRANELDELNELMDNFEAAYSGERLNDVRQLFHSEAVIAHDSTNGERQSVYSLEDWLQGTQEDVFGMNEYISDVLSNREIVVFRNIAYATCDYTYRDDDGTQRGIDIFTFLKMRDRWRIISLQWTGDVVE